jgi:hypothetical protein
MLSPFVRCTVVTLAALSAACSVSTSDHAFQKDPPRGEPETDPEPEPSSRVLVANRERTSWNLAGSRPMDYAIATEVDPTDPLRQVRSIRYTSKEPPAGFGTLMQAFAADRYRGKRVRFSAKVRTASLSGRAGLWMRIDGPNHELLGFDNMQRRPIVGTTPSTRHEVVLDVPAEAHAIAIGLLVAGSGEAFLESPAVEVVGADVPTTGAGARPALGDFRP